MTLAIYAVGAALLAVWLDVRRPAPSLGRAGVHAAGSFLAVQLLVPTLRAVEADRAESMRLVAILLLLILPVFVYAFFALCRLLRLLAELRSLR